MFLLDLFHRMGEAVEIVCTLLYLLKFGETPFGKGGGGGGGACENIGAYLVHA